MSDARAVERPIRVPKLRLPELLGRLRRFASWEPNHDANFVRIFDSVLLSTDRISFTGELQDPQWETLAEVDAALLAQEVDTDFPNENRWKSYASGVRFEVEVQNTFWYHRNEPQALLATWQDFTGSKANCEAILFLPERYAGMIQYDRYKRLFEGSHPLLRKFDPQIHRKDWNDAFAKTEHVSGHVRAKSVSFRYAAALDIRRHDGVCLSHLNLPNDLIRIHARRQYEWR